MVLLSSRKAACIMATVNKFKDQLMLIKTEQHLKTVDIARGIGVSSRIIFYYLSGEKMPDVANLIKLADFLDCSLDFLVGRDFKEK